MIFLTLRDTLLVRLLLNRGASVTLCAALESAICGGNAKIVQLLLNHGADINSVGVNPLDGAAEEGNLAMLEVLYDTGPFLSRHIQDALFRAIQCKQERIIEELISKWGADPHQLSAFNQTTMYVAVGTDCYAIVHLLITEDVYPDADDIRRARLRRCPEVIELLETFSRYGVM
jgi:ankyrin repeat protein